MLFVVAPPTEPPPTDEMMDVPLNTSGVFNGGASASGEREEFDTKVHTIHCTYPQRGSTTGLEY
jgi:hypothetical protein